MIEAVNENRSASFGWEVVQLIDRQTESGFISLLLPSMDLRKHGLLRNWLSKGHPADTKGHSDADVKQGNKWVWIPSTYDLRTHYFRDVGFLACFFAATGSMIYLISGIMGLPGIFNHLSFQQLELFYWTSEVLGGIGMVISGLLFTLETQRHWWQPAYHILGWWIGIFNLVGGFGFFIGSCFGYIPVYWAQYQANCATFWGERYPPYDEFEIQLTMSYRSDGFRDQLHATAL
jgi:hypothetical protein